MKEFPKDIKFKYDWRRYQKRVLSELEGHLDDNHLHIIAPPGSGKTVLGLEVAIRLNKPTLIFAPTVAIRNQWIQRFCELFLQTNERPDWISRDIRNPEFLTVVTYQALHAASTNTMIDEDSEISDTEEESENGENGKTVKTIDTKEIVKSLKEKGIETIIVDEAHHLKNEWWKCLNLIKRALNPTIVGLTATPPYDVTYNEWQRYIDLNGPVDAEISVPELVVENDLCPHQDYIYLSEPTEEESKLIQDQRSKAEKVFEELKKDEVLIKALMNHPIYLNPTENLNWIYNNLACYSSVLIFLNSIGKLVTVTHLEIIGNKKFRIPQLNYEWLEILLSFYLFEDKENFIAYGEHREKLLNKLKRNGLLERKTINFQHNQRVNRLISSSLSKLQSIDNIVDIENKTLGNNLRMVILTDYIRREFLTNEKQNNLVLNKIGVLSIFEQLRRTNDKNMKMGVLSGSLVLIPKTALNALTETSRKLGVENLSFSNLAYDNNYLIVNSNEKLKHVIVQLITQIFEQGEIEVLIGTKSLLGEGWDAPTINSLILASFVGSYVLSNQMRGRAIRSDRKNPDKTGNIWHLICVDHTANNGGDDLHLMKRRFKSFVGINNNEGAWIENGINRLNLPKYFTKLDIENYNEKTIQIASQRENLKNKWKDALLNGVTLTEEIKVPFPEDKDYKEITSLYYYKTIGYLLAVLGASLLTFLQSFLDALSKSAQSIRSREDLFQFLMYFGIVGVVLFGRRFYKTFRILIKYRDISKDVQQIGEALLESLIKVGAIQTEYSKLFVKSSVDNAGAIYCHLDGGTTYEKSIFIKALQEILACIDNPRYLIIRKSLFVKVISQKDYHAVPEIIGQNKKSAEYFERQWKRFVGSCKLIYTRTIEGRKILLKSRINSLSSEFEEKTERINKWR
ncbi:MAG TPA: DEAD/DEAH box helicase family protein [Bacteroidales bacterium]|nr:DEAD/DEAH box helicase family protein [Bacteroidales bacterium]HOR82667.1 DEAD/DEAH box helicase family protein [Bacteroidales bacterium]HPJ92040.1 DEAD/DEAH box helicase family protein [Bacteroidales bacterium]